jgi:rRNA processing protein Krr1/Pno1
MAKKFEEASPEVVKLFDEVRDTTTIPQWVEFKVLCNNKQKQDPVKIVKSNDLVEVLTEGLNFVVIINEKVFNELPKEMQKLAIDE